MQIARTLMFTPSLGFTNFESLGNFPVVIWCMVAPLASDACIHANMKRERRGLHAGTMVRICQTCVQGGALEAFMLSRGGNGCGDPSAVCQGPRPWQLAYA